MYLLQKGYIHRTHQARHYLRVVKGGVRLQILHLLFRKYADQIPVPLQLLVGLHEPGPFGSPEKVPVDVSGEPLHTAVIGQSLHGAEEPEILKGSVKVRRIPLVGAFRVEAAVYLNVLNRGRCSWRLCDTGVPVAW